MRVPIQYSNPPTGERKKDFRGHTRPNTVDHTGSRGHFILPGLLSPLRFVQGCWKPDVLKGRE